MSKQEELFNRFKDVERSIGNLSGIVQSQGSTTTYEELEAFDLDLHRVVNELQALGMSTIMYYKNNNLIKQ